MNFQEFERVAREALDAIPDEFREGIDGLDVRRSTVPHPSYPDVYTLGECLTESYPSEFGGPGDVRSIVVLYYGSFVELSRIDEEWDWEEEIFETVTHEVRHHLESLALDDSLELFDYAQDQNFARRYAGEPDPEEPGRSSEKGHPRGARVEDAETDRAECAEDQNSARHHGERFDPFFYRLGIPRGEAAWELDGDLFVEVRVGGAQAEAREVSVPWDGKAIRLPLPSPLGDVHFLRLDGLEGAAGEVTAVLVARKGWRGWIESLLRPRPLRVLESSTEVPGDV